MVEAIRKESFVQGFIRAFAKSRGIRVCDFSDDQLFAMLKVADDSYAAFRAERTGTL